jgi:prepilin-type N-terminal cleavage/methylation domain-containing protein
MNRTGFTLLEVLVAISILAISMLGIYSLLSHSIRTTQYSKDRLLLIDKGYERVIMAIHFPRIALPSSEEVNGEIIEFEYLESHTVIPGVSEVILRVTSRAAATSYEYFKRN